MQKSRRDFMKKSAAGAAAVAASGVVPQVRASAAKSDVFVKKGKASEAIPAIVEKLGGIEKFVKPKSRIVIKPNMSFANPPEWATTTSPEAVYTMTKMCLDAGAARVIICDNVLRDPDKCRKETGIEDAVKDLKGAVIYIPKEESHYQEVSSDKAKALIRTKVAKQVLRADAVISLPVAKSHSAGGVSLGLKGLMGLVFERGAMHREMDLHMAIADLLYYIKPTFTIIDAARALLDNGPGGPGKVKKLDTFVGGMDPVAVDSHTVTLASWYGKQFKGTNVKYIRNAEELGFGNAAEEKINVVNV